MKIFLFWREFALRLRVKSVCVTYAHASLTQFVHDAFCDAILRNTHLYKTSNNAILTDIDKQNYLLS